MRPQGDTLGRCPREMPHGWVQCIVAGVAAGTQRAAVCLSNPPHTSSHLPTLAALHLEAGLLEHDAVEAQRVGGLLSAAQLHKRVALALRRGGRKCTAAFSQHNITNVEQYQSRFKQSNTARFRASRGAGCWPRQLLIDGEHDQGLPPLAAVLSLGLPSFASSGDASLCPPASPCLRLQTRNPTSPHRWKGTPPSSKHHPPPAQTLRQPLNAEAALHSPERCGGTRPPPTLPSFQRRPPPSNILQNQDLNAEVVLYSPERCGGTLPPHTLPSIQHCPHPPKTLHRETVLYMTEQCGSGAPRCQHTPSPNSLQHSHLLPCPPNTTFLDAETVLYSPGRCGSGAPRSQERCSRRCAAARCSRRCAARPAEKQPRQEVVGGRVSCRVCGRMGWGAVESSGAHSGTAAVHCSGRCEGHPTNR